MMVVKKWPVLLFALVFLLALTGCSSTKTEEGDAENKTNSEAKTIYVGTQPDFPPFLYEDENGKLTGYDIEVVEEIFSRLPEYKLEFKPTSWDGITLGLDSNKTQMIADQMTYNEERAEKYYLSEPYFTSEIYIIVKKGRTDIQSLEDLKGKTLELVVGTTPTTLVEKWNEENGNEINLQYTEATNYTDPLQDVANGRVDAYVENIVNLNQVVKDLNLEVEAAGEPILSTPVVFVYRKDEVGAELKEKIDAILADLKEEGFLSQKSTEWTGSDTIPD